MDFTKLDDNTLQATTIPVTPEPVTNTYDYDFLQQQLIDIQAQKDRDNAARDAELAEVQALIDAADQLGITAKIIAEPPIIKPPINP